MFSDDSASDGDSYCNSDDEETEVHEQKVADGIRDGYLVVKNGDGTYKCPLSPGRKKQSYKYRELLAHATQIGSGKKGPEKVGGHRALEKFLLAELGGKPMVAQAERVLHLEQAVPSRRGASTRLLAPWMGILVNIDNTRTNENGLRVAAGAADIKEKFQEYNPEKVEVFHDYYGHQGTAILTFRNDIHGLEDAQAFAHDFATANRGRKEWWDEKRAYSLDLYGWQATEEDLTANLGQLTAYLKKFCDLKSVRDMVEEKERLHKLVVEELVKTVDQKNYMVAASRHRNMVHEVDALRVKAEEEKRRMEEQHKRDVEAMQLQFTIMRQYTTDLEAMQLQVQAKEASHNERVLAHQMALTKELRALEGRCEAMKEAEVQMRQKNEAERQRFEREKQDTEKLLGEAREQAELHAAMQYKQREEQKSIIKKHEGESKALEMAVQDQKRKLIERQELELQKQHAKEMLEIEKSNETDKERIAELESEQDVLQGTVNALSQKERTSNDLLEDVRKAAVQVLDTYGVDGRIGNKLMGSINKGPWAAACRNKFKYHPDGWELVMTKLISEWEKRIGDQSYNPYKMLKLDPEGNNWKRIINEDDEFIKKLNEDLGAEVMQTVATAFFEIEEYNASGRYPMWVAWNFVKNERLQPKDLLLFLNESLDDAMRKLVKPKTKRARVGR